VSDNPLIIDPALLADIRAQCQRRRAELEAAEALPGATIVPGLPQTAVAALPASLPIPTQESEAQRFAAAVDKMPAGVRRFFEREDPVGPHRWESDEDCEERHMRAELGGWPGG
jgi:hypothetical protein